MPLWEAGRLRPLRLGGRRRSLVALAWPTLDPRPPEFLGQPRLPARPAAPGAPGPGAGSLVGAWHTVSTPGPRPAATPGHAQDRVHVHRRPRQSEPQAPGADAKPSAGACPGFQGPAWPRRLGAAQRPDALAAWPQVGRLETGRAAQTRRPGCGPEGDGLQEATAAHVGTCRREASRWPGSAASGRGRAGVRWTRLGRCRSRTCAVRPSRAASGWSGALDRHAGAGRRLRGGPAWGCSGQPGVPGRWPQAACASQPLTRGAVAGQGCPALHCPRGHAPPAAAAPAGPRSRRVAAGPRAGGRGVNCWRRPCRALVTRRPGSGARAGGLGAGPGAGAGAPPGGSSAWYGRG